MTPLEAASTAYNYERSRWRVQERHPPKPRFRIMRSDYESETTDVIFETDDHGEIHVQFDRLRDDASMRAALLALAECELPDDLVAHALKNSASKFPEGHFVGVREGYRIEFRAMLRSIANEGKDNG